MIAYVLINFQIILARFCIILLLEYHISKVLKLVDSNSTFCFPNEYYQIFLKKKNLKYYPNYTIHFT